MPPVHKILIVEDEPTMLAFIQAIFKRNGYTILTADTGKKALKMIRGSYPDIIILDLGLPDTDGFKIIHDIRSWSDIPVIVVSARSEENDKVSALEIGADDYITKPFGSSELLARIKTAIRHSALQNNIQKYQSTLSSGLTIDYINRKVYVKNNEIHLTKTEYSLVELLSKNAGKILTYDFILKSIWNKENNSNNKILRVNMANIRKKFKTYPDAPEFIITEPGIGYKMNI